MIRMKGIPWGVFFGLQWIPAENSEKTAQTVFPIHCYSLFYATSLFIIIESMGPSEFYDNFITYQIKTGINDRIFGLYKRVCSLSISNNDRILEIGCGIGSLTYLLSQKVKKGKIEAIDISPKSIEFAKKECIVFNIGYFGFWARKFNIRYNSIVWCVGTYSWRKPG